MPTLPGYVGGETVRERLSVRERWRHIHIHIRCDAHAHTFQKYGRTAGKGIAADHYPLMDDQALLSLPVDTLAMPDCALLLWTTSSFLPLALECMGRWGFEYKCVFFVWVKTTSTKAKRETKSRREKKVHVTFDGEEEGEAGLGLVPFFGLGSYTRASTEMCLLGVRGNVLQWKQSSGVRQLLFAPVREHSRKPEEARQGIEEFFGAPEKTSKIELFARERVEGWDAWGLEVE